MKSTGREPFQTDINPRRNYRSRTDANICSHGERLSDQKVKSADDTRVVRQHKWGNIDGPNAQFTACDKNIKTMTGTMCCSNHMLNETMLVKNIEEIDDGKSEVTSK